MLKKLYFFAGIVFLLIGTTIFLNSFQNITGLAIVDEIEGSQSGLAGTLYIFAGLFSLYLSKRKKRSGQAAMEFLMTYGWAILAALIAIGTLAYFGVFNSNRLVAGYATIDPPFSIIGHQVRDTFIKLEIRNGGIDTYTIQGANINFEDLSTCSSTQIQDIDPGKNKIVTIACDLTDEDKINAQIELRYRKTSGLLTLVAWGIIRDEVFLSPGSETVELLMLIDGDGSVTCNNENCNDEFGNPTIYSLYDIVTLEATPGEESIFVRWNGGNCDGVTSTECSLIMDRDLSINAEFAPSMPEG